MSGRVVVLGSINVDHVVHLDEFPKPGETLLAQRVDLLAGGKGANQAVSAAAAGARVVMVGCVGSDPFGSRYVDRLAARGIDTSAIRVVPGTTGTAYVTVDAARENTVVVAPGANAQVELADLQRVMDLGSGDVVVLQLEIPLPTVRAAVDWAHGRGARVVLNVAPWAQLDAATLALADPIVANEHEAMALADSGGSAGSLLVTLGANGAIWDGTQVLAAAVPGGVVRDTTGAGDAYVGALAAALAAGADRPAAMHSAAHAGAAAVATLGAQPDGSLT